MVSLPELARRGDVALRDLLSRVARRAGWTPTVLGHPGYGSGGRVRVLGRVLLAPVHTAPQERRPVAGWQRLLTLESPRTDVTVELAGQRFPACSDDDGLLDVTLDVALPDTGAVPVVIRAGERASRTVLHLASPDAGRGVVCDIDDTVLVTGIATPLRAAWRTFVQPVARRRAVPGMAELLRELTTGAPHVPVVYLSNGPWNLAGPLVRFLERAGLPPGALLLTDWGPTPGRLFRDGRAHKRTSLQRLATDLPGVRWTLVGDTGEHDPALYEEFVRSAPEQVEAVLLRDVGDGTLVATVDGCRSSVHPTVTPSPRCCPRRRGVAGPGEDRLLRAQAGVAPRRPVDPVPVRHPPEEEPCGER